MKIVQLKGQLRTEIGKKASKANRNSDNIPCILYGGKEENLAFTIFINDLKKVIYTPEVSLMSLAIDGKTHNAILKQATFHPVTDLPIHVDFQRIYEDKPIIISIPVATEGLAAGVKAGGILTLSKRKLKVSALPKHLPDAIVVNIEQLNIGDVIKIGSIQKENLEFKDNKDALLISVKSTRASKQAEELGPAPSKN